MKGTLSPPNFAVVFDNTGICIIYLSDIAVCGVLWHYIQSLRSFDKPFPRNIWGQYLGAHTYSMKI